MSDMSRKSEEAAPLPHDEIDPNSQIVLKLQTLYRSIEQEPIPNLFLDLLEQLDRVETARMPDA